jgi:intein-encoded DNA endonuclease-like protein
MFQVRTISREVLFKQSCLDDPSETTRRAPFSKEEIVAYLQGALHDASLNKRKRYRFTQKGTAWLLVLKELFEFLGHKSWMYKEGINREVYTLETLAEFLDFSFDLNTLNSVGEQLAYVRGFFDAEGGIPSKKDNRFYIQLVQKDKVKLEKIKDILKISGISAGVIHNPSKRIDPNYWRMFVSTHTHKRFAQMVGSWHPRKMRIFRERMVI